MIRFASAEIAIVFASCMALCLGACDKLLPKGKGKWAPQSIGTDAEPVDDQFRDARSKIMAGKYPEAAEMLQKLDARSGVQQPLHNWITVYWGLAELFAGREVEARAVFTRLVQRGAFSEDRGDRKIVSFFTDLGTRLGAEGPIPGEIARNYDVLNHEALALLLCALKNEAVGSLDEALTFYRRFTTSSSQEAEPWIGFNNQMMKLRRAASNVLENQDQFESASKAIFAVKTATTPDEKKAAIEEAKAARSRIKGAGKLTESLDAAIGAIEPKIDALMAEQTRTLAEDEEHDAKALPAAKAKRAELVALYKFAEAKQAMSEPQLRTEKARLEQELLVRKTAYLENFKYNLIQDLPKGYPQPVTLKNGAVASRVTKLDEQSIHVTEKGQSAPIPWSDISPESIYAMAKSLLTPGAPAEFLTFRKWYLGIYAAFIGKTAEGRALMSEAAKENPVYEPEIALVLGDAS